MKIVAPKFGIGYHEIGYCITSPDTDYAFLPIPKNSSTYTENIFRLMCGWEDFGNILYHKNIRDKKKIVTLRDPYKRYVSGLIEHFYRNGSHLKFNDENFQYVFNHFAVDTHTELQVIYLNDIDTENCVFLYMDQNYDKTLRKVIESTIKKPYILHKKKNIVVNSTSGNEVKKRMYDSFSKYIATNKNKLTLLREYLKPDYELMRQIKFYNKTPEHI